MHICLFHKFVLDTIEAVAETRHAKGGRRDVRDGDAGNFGRFWLALRLPIMPLKILVTSRRSNSGQVKWFLIMIFFVEDNTPEKEIEGEILAEGGGTGSGGPRGRQGSRGCSSRRLFRQTWSSWVHVNSIAVLHADVRVATHAGTSRACSPSG